MEYRYLGRTGVRVSPLCLGCMMFGGRTGADESAAIIDRAIDAGINFIDTANKYSFGKSETITGKALKRNGKRGMVVLATKCNRDMQPNEPLSPNRFGNSRRHIIEECHHSLKRLQTDYIDLYQLHRPDVACPIDETLRALDDLVRAGKVRYIGASTFAAWQVVESLWCADRYSLCRFVSEQPPYNLLDRRIERELVPVAQTFGLAVLPWSPLAQGFLTGKYKRGEQTPDGARIHPKMHRAAMLENEHAYDVVEQLEKLVAEKGCAMSQFALAWCMSQPGVTSPIIGPRTMEQLEDNLKSLEVEIKDADRAAVDAIIPPCSMVYPFYELEPGPRPHAHRW